ncbi:hypothetical protein MKK64_27965 [Methylobacterium sp. E-025]|uniref:hypothetical protein n=1 Tax=Methylobacterium sp. E-025 TaxID=2836561 RepID=UPI001FBB5A91|nr:hypothetical protein [Methylobacterium sp. E-025]MCJ2114996.1 hypothetical protein [Methylobacterium sp. E-025]
MKKNKKKSTKENRLKYAGLALSASGWIAFSAAQYRASAFPFDKAMWSALYSGFQNKGQTLQGAGQPNNNQKKQ